MVDGNNDCFFDTTNRILEVEHIPYNYKDSCKAYALI